ncbi:hypothetical protein K1719_004209 [Acacia pycnantha]|nr:hypothetical protein K1719_004209 [Acacia pycnantha]
MVNKISVRQKEQGGDMYYIYVHQYELLEPFGKNMRKFTACVNVLQIPGSPNSRFFICRDFRFSKFQVLHIGSWNSVYTFKMRKEQSCTVACRVTLGAESAKNFQEKIDDEYRVNM